MFPHQLQGLLEPFKNLLSVQRRIAVCAQSRQKLPLSSDTLLTFNNVALGLFERRFWFHLLPPSTGCRKSLSQRPALRYLYACPSTVVALFSFLLNAAMNEQTIAAKALLKLCNDWTDRAVEAIHVLVHAGESREAIRDACIFVGGSMIGQLLTLRIPMDCVNAAGIQFFASCEQAMREHLPDMPDTTWPTMSTLQ